MFHYDSKLGLHFRFGLKSFTESKFFYCRSEILLNIDPVENSYAIRVGDMKVIFGKYEGDKYGGWIKPEETVEPEIELVDGYKMQFPEEASDDETPEQLFRSPRMQTIFEQLGRVGGAPHPAVVNCGDKPANASTNCDVGKAPCLYNIRKDPCEYNNLANEMPDVVKGLLDKLDLYKKTMVEPRNKPNDPKGNPRLHHGIWEPWVNLSKSLN